MQVLRKIADSHEMSSFATHLRRKRLVLFEAMLASLPRPLTILDVGGTPIFWETMHFTNRCDVQIVLLDLSEHETHAPNLASVVGDGRDMSQFASGSFDVVFSNSVIEHVGDREDQRRMAEEIRRVGRYYFVQTPNRYFPLEPHFLFPCFQFLPLKTRVMLVQHFDLGWYGMGGIPDRAQAEEVVRAIQLLSVRDVRALFPDALLYRERLFGLTKSLVAYGGWVP